MHLSVHVPVIGLLVHDQSFGAGLNQRIVVGGLHRPDLQRQRRDKGVEGSNTSGHVTVGDELGVLSGH